MLGHHCRSIDLAPASRTSFKLGTSVNQHSHGPEKEPIDRRADHWLPEAGRGGNADQGGLPQQRGFSDGTFYKWRSKFGGMEASEAQRLRGLEAENAELKKLLAEAHLDMHALKSVLGVKRYPHRLSARPSGTWWRNTSCLSVERAVLFTI